jgi:tRNA acetyltransferase TAN1
VVYVIPEGANLLANTAPGREGEGVGQLKRMLIEMGERNPATGKTGTTSLIYGKTKLNVQDVISELRTLVEKQPNKVKYITRLAPIDTLLPADLKLMTKEAEKLSVRVSKDETFRIVVEKKNAKLSDQAIITSLAGVFHRKVNLNNPDWILLVEVMGEEATISLQKPSNIVSTSRLRARS